CSSDLVAHPRRAPRHRSACRWPLPHAMTPDTTQSLKDKIASLADELSHLERKRDDIAQRRCSGEAASVFATISDVQRRLDAAKRLLARGEGDDYDFVTRFARGRALY